MSTLCKTAAARYQTEIELAAQSFDRCPDIGQLAVLGPAGSYSHIVAADLNTKLGSTSKLDIVYPGNFAEVLEAAAQPGQAAIMPLRNQIGGEVKHMAGSDMTNQDAIIRRGGLVLATVGLPIEHCLMATGRIKLRDAARLTVRSHAQALVQCTRIIERLKLQPVEASSTSAAARSLRAEVELEEPVLAIGPRIAAAVYDLAIIGEDVGDKPARENITTMAIVKAPPQ